MCSSCNPSSGGTGVRQDHTNGRVVDRPCPLHIHLFCDCAWMPRVLDLTRRAPLDSTLSFALIKSVHTLCTHRAINIVSLIHISIHATRTIVWYCIYKRIWPSSLKWLFGDVFMVANSCHIALFLDECVCSPLMWTWRLNKQFHGFYSSRYS